MIARMIPAKRMIAWSLLSATVLMTPAGAYAQDGQNRGTGIAQAGGQREETMHGSIRKASKPEEIADLFIAYANAGDVEGILSLFEDAAVVAGVGDHPNVQGKEAIRANFTRLLSTRPQFVGVVQRPAIVNGDIALTSARLPNGFVTTEVARRQADGSWLWIIDQPMAAVVPVE